MTLNEYLNQADPQPNLAVVLNESEYKVQGTVKINPNTYYTFVDIPIIAERFKIEGRYVRINDGARLYAPHPETGEINGRGSVFYLQPHKSQTEDVIGVYAVRSPYHEEEFYLPFVILSRRTFDRCFAVDTVEYKGTTAYKVESDYPEQTIHELLDNGIIVKWGNCSEISAGGKITELVNVFWKAQESIE